MKAVTRLLIIAAIGLQAVFAAPAATRSPKSDVARNLDIFNAIVKEFQLHYVDTIDIDKAVTTAIDAMLAQLDPYTEYMSHKESNEFMSLTTGEYGGIGSYIRYTPKGTIIAGPEPGSPAEKAGLRTGDLIIGIDTTDVTGWNDTRVRSLLQGTPGTDLTIKVNRPYVGADSIRQFTLTREKIQMPSVPYYGRLKKAPSIGYVDITSFTDKTGDEVKRALEALKAEGPLGGIILDLRGNGGGLLDAAVATVGCFVPKGTEVVRTRGRGAMEEKIYKTTSRPILPDVPLAILVDGGTASSSEITAGALQDLDRAVILGSRSFGKGLVQRQLPLSDSSAVRITTARYYTPSGRCIQKRYTPGDQESYELDIYERLSHGESLSADSITLDKSVTYYTSTGREVYGGGGIMPDVFVPADTTGYSK